MKKTLLLLSIGVLFSIYSSAQVTYNVTVPLGTNTCYISGAMNSWTFTEMTKVDNTHYTLTIAAATTAQGYKYLSGPSWSYEERSADGINITVKARTPWSPTNIHFWGDAASTWPGEVMTQVGDFWQYTFNQVTIMNMIFNNGTGGTGFQTSDILTITANTCFIINADASYSVVDCSTFTSVSTPEKPTIKINSDNSRISVELDGNAKMSIYSMQGALIKQTDFRNTYSIDNLNSGLYLLIINGQTFKALVK